MAEREVFERGSVIRSMGGDASVFTSMVMWHCRCDGFRIALFLNPNGPLGEHSSPPSDRDGLRPQLYFNTTPSTLIHASIMLLNQMTYYWPHISYDNNIKI